MSRVHFEIVIGDLYLVVELSRVKAMSLSKQGEMPVGDHIFPRLADWVCQELYGRLRETDGWKSESVQSIQSTADETEGNANEPHSDSKARQCRIIRLESYTSSRKHLFI